MIFHQEKLERPTRSAPFLFALLAPAEVQVDPTPSSPPDPAPIPPGPCTPLHTPLCSGKVVTELSRDQTIHSSLQSFFFYYYVLFFAISSVNCDSNLWSLCCFLHSQEGDAWVQISLLNLKPAYCLKTLAVISYIWHIATSHRSN